jgi:hypothetical protein
MNQGDIEFHELDQQIIGAIANEGLRIAKANHWKGLLIEINFSGPLNGFGAAGVRYTLWSGISPAEVDEPSSSMLDLARRLQELYFKVGNPLAGATIDWTNSEDKDGRVRRRSVYRYR